MTKKSVCQDSSDVCRDREIMAKPMKSAFGLEVLKSAFGLEVLFS